MVIAISYLKVLRIQGGGKRARVGGAAGITNFTIEAGDPDAVKDALSLRFQGLADFVRSKDVTSLYDYVIEQKNGDRIVAGFCDVFAEFVRVQDESAKKYILHFIIYIVICIRLLIMLVTMLLFWYS